MQYFNVFQAILPLQEGFQLESVPMANLLYPVKFVVRPWLILAPSIAIEKFTMEKNHTSVHFVAGSSSKGERIYTIYLSIFMAVCIFLIKS